MYAGKVGVWLCQFLRKYLALAERISPTLGVPKGRSELVSQQHLNQSHLLLIIVPVELLL